MGGWAGVRSALVDDMALCRAVKSGGGRVVFADGDRMADCRMYDGAAALRSGFAKTSTRASADARSGCSS